MDDYRTPDEAVVEAEQTARIQAVLDEAVQDGASLMVAMQLAEDTDVIALWVDAFWDNLRAGLTDDQPDRAGLRQEDRLAAIAILLEQRIRDATQAVLTSIPRGGAR